MMHVQIHGRWQSCDVFDVALRWLGAVGITLAPLGFFVLPGLLHPEPLRDRRGSGQSNGGKAPVGEYLRTGLQSPSARPSSIPAALGIGGYTIARGRGRALGAIGLATGMVAAVALLVVMGFELAMLTILISSTDTDAAVAQMIGLRATPCIHGIPLLVGLIRLLPNPAAPRARAVAQPGGADRRSCAARVASY